MVTTHQAYRFALDPSAGQERDLLSHVGGSRFAYNYLLATVKSAINQRQAEESYGVPEADLTGYVNVSHYSLRRLWNERKGDVAPWWESNSKEAYSDAAKRLSGAMGNFFDSRTGGRKGRTAGFPRFHRRGTHESIRFTTGVMRLEPDRHHVTLPRLGTLRTHESTRKLARRVEAGTARILSSTVTRSGRGWFVSFTVEVERPVTVTRNPVRVIGIDVGIKTLYTGATCDGTHVLAVPNPRNTRRSGRALGRAQRVMSRRQGPDRRTNRSASSRWLKAKSRVTRIHKDTANRRLDLIHKTTTALAKNHDVIVVESLNVAGMVRNHCLAKAVSDAAFGEFVRQLRYKTTWHGSTLVAADRFYPSSKTCSDCGAVKTKLLLSEREYVCTSCGTVIDRDLNAAVNLARLGVMSPTGSGPVAGRGGKHKTVQPSGRTAAADETSISMQPLRVA